MYMPSMDLSTHHTVAHPFLAPNKGVWPGVQPSFPEPDQLSSHKPLSAALVSYVGQPAP